MFIGPHRLPRPAAYALLLASLAAAACSPDDAGSGFGRGPTRGNFGAFTIDGHVYETYVFANDVEDRREDFLSFESTTIGPDFDGEVPPLPPDYDFSAYHPYAFAVGGAIDYTTAREYEVVSLLRSSHGRRFHSGELLADTVGVIFTHENGHADVTLDRFYTDTVATAVQRFSLVPTARGDSVDVSLRFQMLRRGADRPPPGTAWDLPTRFELVVEPIRIAVPPPRAPE